ncbi:PD-(D/E)XK nuclease family protein [Candidatus Alkanophaga liquidiphilum]
MSTELKRQLFELLERDREFRLSVAGLLGYRDILERLETHDRKFNEILQRLEELGRRSAEHDRKFNEILERLDRHEAHLAEHDRKFNEILERLDRHGVEIKALREDFRTFQRRLDALGARWGLMSEAAFREGMKGIVEKHFGGHVEQWLYYDEQGLVFGFPATVEVDLLIKDKEHILVEIKSHVRRSDVAMLLRKGKLYERVKGAKPKLVLVSPYIEDAAKSDAERLGIEVFAP